MWVTREPRSGRCRRKDIVPIQGYTQFTISSDLHTSSGWNSTAPTLQSLSWRLHIPNDNG